MKAKARSILSTTLAPEAGKTLNFVEAIRRHVEPLGGIELEEHLPVVTDEPLTFGRWLCPVPPAASRPPRALRTLRCP